MSVWSAMISQYCVRAYLQEFVFKNNSNDHETWSIQCHVEIHVNFTSILHSYTPFIVWNELDQFYLLHQWEGLKCNGHGLSVLCVKWPLGVMVKALDPFVN